MGPSLERIGAGAFDYDFGALDDTDNPFTKSYTNVLYDYLGHPWSKVPAALTGCTLSASPPSETLLDYSFSP